MRRVFVFLGILFLLPAAAQAATVYTDHDTWLAQLYGDRTDDLSADAENFNGATPFTTALGMKFSTVSGQSGAVQIISDGLVNGTNEIHFREFGAGMLLKLPEPVRAVGFFYDTAVESWTVEFAGSTHTLSPHTKGFLGFVETCELHDTIKFHSPPGGAQGGISLDDISVETARTFRAGMDDALAAPNDPTWRSAALTAIISPNRWKDFDDPDFNQWLGQTFAGLPANITRAVLRVAMKPQGGGSGNDAIALGLTGSTFSYSAYIEDLPGANNTWLSNAETVFTFDLASLPGGGDILAKVAAERVLDVRVQDDTTVDWMDLRVWTCPAYQWMCGLPAVGLGDAEIVSSDNAVLVRRIGTTGHDGVRIDLGEAEGFAGTLDDLPYALPPGAFHQWTTRGTVDGVPDRPIWIEKHDLVAAGNRKEVRVAMDSSSIGSTSNSLKIYNRGALVYSSVLPNGELYSFVPESNDPPALAREAVRDGTLVVIVIDPWPIRPAKATALIKNYDTIVTESLGPKSAVTAVTAIEATAAGVPQFTVANQAVVLFDRPNRVVGRAALEAFGGALTVANLRPAGSDGVRVDFGKTSELDVELAPIDPRGIAPAGAFLRATAFGSRAGIPDQSLGTLTIAKKNGAYEIAADFSAIGAPSQHIEIYDQGRLVADVYGHTGVAATASAWPRKIGKLGGQTECYSSDFDRDTAFVLDGVTYRGDRIHVLAEGLTETIDYKSALVLQAGGGIAEFTLSGTTAQFCPGSIEVLPASLPRGAAGSPYPATRFLSTSAYGPFSLSISGALPPGMTFGASGVLSGTPSVTGSFPITVTATNVQGCIGTRTLVLEVVATTRAVRLGSVTARPGATIELPIVLQSSGDENALAFSIGFNPTILGNADVVLAAGAGAATIRVNNSRAAEGFIGVAMSLPPNQVFAASAQHVATARFTVSATTVANTTAAVLGDQPLARAISDRNAQSLPASYVGGTVTIARGFEADVAPRPNGDGDGTVTTADWNQIGRFVAGLDVAAPGSEFQRADSAPRNTSGDGAITLADWVQAGRYAAGLDPVQPAAGPTQTTASRAPVSDALRAASTRTMRLAATPARGGAARVTIQLDAMGDENAFAGRLTFDPARWRFVLLARSGDGAAAVLHVNAARASGGEVAFALALPPGVSLSTGVRALLVAELEPIGPSSPAAATLAIAGEVVESGGTSHALIPVGRER